jgi:hypothetical protein
MSTPNIIVFSLIFENAMSYRLITAPHTEAVDLLKLAGVTNYCNTVEIVC